MLVSYENNASGSTHCSSRFKTLELTCYLTASFRCNMKFFLHHCFQNTTSRSLINQIALSSSLPYFSLTSLVTYTKIMTHGNVDQPNDIVNHSYNIRKYLFLPIDFSKHRSGSQLKCTCICHQHILHSDLNT